MNNYNNNKHVYKKYVHPIFLTPSKPLSELIKNRYSIYIYTSEDISIDESDIKEVIDIPRFVKKSNWIPKPSKNTRLESVIDLIKSDSKNKMASG